MGWCDSRTFLLGVGETERSENGYWYYIGGWRGVFNSVGVGLTGQEPLGRRGAAGVSDLDKQHV